MTNNMTVKEMIEKLSRRTIDNLSEVVFENELGIFEWDISVNCIADKVLIIKLKKVESK